jgi:glycosyltransferase involved in cell wall biosynthesis
MRPLRIGIDVHSIGSRSGGNETYYHELVKALAEAPRDHHFVLYYTNESALNWIKPSANFSTVRLRPANRALRIPFTFAWRAQQDHLDVFHAQYIVPPFLRCRTVTTIADIAYERFPDFFPAHQRAAFKMLIPWSARRADHIITVSDHSKRDLVSSYSVPQEKVSVTYEGAAAGFIPLERSLAKQRLAAKYKLHENFILYVGRLQARKNLGQLVAAYAALRRSGCRHKLVLVGKADSLFGPVLAQVRAEGLDREVVLTGYVPDEDLPSFYSAADLFVYPSFYEGFGLPVVEAMACGVPVVTSKGSSLEELAGESALLVDPMDVKSIESAMGRVLSDAGLAERMVEDGLRRSRQFSFKNTASQTIDVYEHLMAQGPGEYAQGN